MKKLLILIITISLFGCVNSYSSEEKAVITKIQKSSDHKYAITISGQCNDFTFFTNKEYKIGQNILNNKDYQFQITDQDHALLYDGDRLVGGFKFTNTELDSLITKDNQ